MSFFSTGRSGSYSILFISSAIIFCSSCMDLFLCVGCLPGAGSDDGWFHAVEK
jgi:hypothetical protein